MRTITFAKRCGKEILRDPLNLGFGLGFPLALLLLLTTIQENIPVSLFEIDTLTPGTIPSPDGWSTIPWIFCPPSWPP